MTVERGGTSALLNFLLKPAGVNKNVRASVKCAAPLNQAPGKCGAQGLQTRGEHEWGDEDLDEGRGNREQGREKWSAGWFANSIIPRRISPLPL